MDFLKKNIPAAAVILVLAVILSVWLGTLRSVSSLESKAEKAYAAKDSYGETVGGTVDVLKLHISAFVAEYEAVLGACDESEYLRKCADALDGDSCIAEGVDADDLMGKALLMHQRFDASGSYTAEARSAYAGIDNDISILKKYDDYNAAAKLYNEVSDSFIGKIFGLEKAIEF